MSGGGGRGIGGCRGIGRGLELGLLLIGFVLMVVVVVVVGVSGGVVRCRRCRRLLLGHRLLAAFYWVERFGSWDGRRIGLSTVRSWVVWWFVSEFGPSSNTCPTARKRPDSFIGSYARLSV